MLGLEVDGDLGGANLALRPPLCSPAISPPSVSRQWPNWPWRGSFAARVMAQGCGRKLAIQRPARIAVPVHIKPSATPPSFAFASISRRCAYRPKPSLRFARLINSTFFFGSVSVSAQRRKSAAILMQQIEDEKHQLALVRQASQINASSSAFGTSAGRNARRRADRSGPIRRREWPIAWGACRRP